MTLLWILEAQWTNEWLFVGEGAPGPAAGGAGGQGPTSEEVD
jgi:hypothetical protein